MLFHLLLSHGFSAAGGWRGGYSPGEGISAFLWDQSLEPALSLEQWAQPGLPVPGRLHCSAPGFIFVRAWSGGGGDQVTVPEERWHRLSCHRVCTCRREQGAGTDEGVGLDGQGGCSSSWDPFSWMPWRLLDTLETWERGCSLSVETTDAPT